MEVKPPLVLGLMLLSSLLVACAPSQVELDATSTQIASDIFATQTADAPTITPTFTVTPSPIPTSTPIPTITPTPSPDLSKVVLSLADLPLGFESVPPDEFGLQRGAPFISGGTIDSSFVFGIEVEDFEIIAGSMTLIPNRLDQAQFDSFVPDIPNLIFDVADTLLGAGDIEEPKNVRELEDIGDIAFAASTVLGGEGPAIRWDVILFRRGQVGVLAYAMYLDGDVPVVNIDDVAKLMDDRIKEEGPEIAGGFEIPDVEEGKFNVAMVLVGPYDDGGWSEAHYDGLLYIEDNIPDASTAFIELVSEGADSDQVFRSLARKGFDLIIGTSFGYMIPMEIVADEFPNQMFIHLTGFKTNRENYGNMYGEMEVFTYLAGMLAGSRAVVDGNPRLGYMATFPIPEELRLGNAIMLGAKQTCPQCTMDIRWINTWHDPSLEREGAASLFDAGVQVVITGADTPAAGEVAAERGKWSVNYTHISVCQTDGCLTAPYWIWGPIYADIARGTIDGTYEPGFHYFDSSEGGMGLFGFMEGQNKQPGIAGLPAEDVQLVRDTLAAALRGDFDRFDVFKGPIFDNQGNQILAEGVSLEQLDLDGFAEFGAPCETCMYWWADGVTAELPDLGG